MADEELQPTADESENAKGHEEAIAPEEQIQALETKLTQLEAALEEQRQALATRAHELQTKDQQIAALKEQLEPAVTRYREMVLAKTPEVPEELVTGETIEEVDASLTAAQAMVDRVKKQIEARAAAERVPTGAPARTPPDLSALSPKEKIAYALSRG